MWLLVRFAAALHDFVDMPPFKRFFGGHPLVAVKRLLDRLVILTGMTHVKLIETLARLLAEEPQSLV